MRQELIDLLRGELSESEERDLRARLAQDAALRGELDELTALFGLMRRGEEVSPLANTRAKVLSAARGAVAPPLGARLRALPGLVAFRLRRSIGFRVAAASVVAHLVLMAVLFQMTARGPAPERVPLPFDVSIGDQGPERFTPDGEFTRRLRARGYGHHLRIGLYGVEGQERRIAEALESWVSRQQPDGSFGEIETTAQVCLALLAEGDNSHHPTPRGRALGDAIRFLIREAGRPEAGDATLAALVEDYVLAFEPRRQEALVGHLRAIGRLIPRVASAPGAGEGLALAQLAGMALPPELEAAVASSPLLADRDALLSSPATRLAATAVLSKGQTGLDPARLRSWLAPLFAAAMESADRDPVALLTLQAPYRL